jgi:hypothetical protein
MEITSKDEKHYVKLWIDGIPSNYIEYNSKDEGFFGTDKITIGSNDCDVLLYQIKFYESELDIDEHMHNFYADAPSGSEMVARFNRNNIIYDGESEIDPFLVAEANPDCLVHIYEIAPGARVPTYKGDTQPCSYK